MNMKQHILAAVREEFDRWEELLASLSEEQITALLLLSIWSIKDVMAHLMAWQQRYIARVQAARLPLPPSTGFATTSLESALRVFESC